MSLKLECLQKTGSFKPRGAFNKMLTLSSEERGRGVVAVSGGNHAQGVAYAAQQLGHRAVICMPRTTPANYLEATRGYGAEIVLTPDIASAFARAQELQADGMTLVHPFDDPLVAAGQGTIGLEIHEDAPDATHVFISIGGGGLLAGVATALRGQNPKVQIIGVETEGADAMTRALAAGQPVELPAITSIARTLGAPGCPRSPWNTPAGWRGKWSWSRMPRPSLPWCSCWNERRCSPNPRPPAAWRQRDGCGPNFGPPITSSCCCAAAMSPWQTSAAGARS